MRDAVSMIDACDIKFEMTGIKNILSIFIIF